MTEQENIQGKAQAQGVDDISSESSVQEIVEWIRDGIDEERDGSDIMRVVMDIPSARRISGNKSAAALKEMLSEYSIELPSDVMDSIEAGTVADFNFAAPAREKYLRSRNVFINTAPEICTLMISGEEPVDGIPGSIKVYYDFSIKSGKLFADGSIDFREINMFPQAKKEVLLLRIFEPTSGVAGTDVYGCRVSPRSGDTVHVELGENVRVEKGYDEEQKRNYTDLTAANAGIIVTDFGGDTPLPENIKGISIQNRLELEDIDFTTGNVSGNGGELRCIADVSVKGDIRGAFSVLIEGTLKVKGTVEGKRIDASGEVIAHLIRSTIRSGKFITTVSAVNAKLIARDYVRIGREFTHCTIKAPYVIFEGERGGKVLCGRADISTDKLEARDVELRNQLEIILGEKLLAQWDALKISKEKFENMLETEDTNLKTRAHVFGEKMQITHSVLPDNMRKIIIGIKKQAAGILSGSLKPDTASVTQDKLSGSLGAEFSPMLDQLKRMIKVQQKREEIILKLHSIKEQIDVILDSLRKITVEIHGNINPKGQIIIMCGSSEKKWTGEGTAGSRLSISLGYDPQRGLYDKEGMEIPGEV